MDNEELLAELSAMQAIVDALTPLESGPDNGSIGRVMRWAIDRYAVELGT